MPFAVSDPAQAQEAAARAHGDVQTASRALPGPLAAPMPEAGHRGSADGDTRAGHPRHES